MGYLKAAVTKQPAQARKPSLTEQTFWFATAKTIAFVLMTAVPLMLVRLLDQTELGLYKQAFLLIATAMRILTLGFGLSAFYFYPRMRGQEQSVTASIVFFNTAVGLLAWLVIAIHPPLLKSVFGTPDLVRYANLIGAIIFLSIFGSFLEIAPAAMQDTKVSTVLIVLMQLSKMLFMVFAALWSSSLKVLLWAAMAQGLLQSVILWRYLQHRFGGFWRAFSCTEFLVQFRYILPLTVAYFIGTSIVDVPQYLVANHFGPALYAVFTIGTFQLPLIGILHESIGMVLMPTVSRYHHEGRDRDVVLVWAAAMRKTAAIALPAYFGLMIVGQQFIVALYTPRYAAAAPIFAVNLLMLPLTVIIYEPLVRTFEPVRKLLVLLRVVLLVALVAAVWIGTRQGSMIAAIWAVVVAAALERGLIFAKMTRILNLTWHDAVLFKDIGKITLASAIGSVVVWIVNSILVHQNSWVSLITCGIVFCAVYVAGILILKVPTMQELEIGSRLLRRLLPKRLARSS